ncbi:hypothetical protein QF002_007962 [Paraburkholderia youngii]
MRLSYGDVENSGSRTTATCMRLQAAVEQIKHDVAPGDRTAGSVELVEVEQFGTLSFRRTPRSLMEFIRQPGSWHHWNQS